MNIDKFIQTIPILIGIGNSVVVIMTIVLGYLNPDRR